MTTPKANRSAYSTTTKSRLNLPPSPRVVASEKLVRPEGYSIPGYDYLAVTLDVGGIEATGYGASRSPEESFEKAYSEALERASLFHFCRQMGLDETSNGWACHNTETLAIESALLELIERDVALSCWLNCEPFYELPKSLWPRDLLSWQSALRATPEFFELRILLCENKNGACISALLFNEKGNFVAGHASSLNMNAAIISASIECFRAAHAALRFEHFSAVRLLHSRLPTTVKFSPGVHSLAYAYSAPIPDSIDLVQIDEDFAKSKWQGHRSKFSNLLRDKLNLSLFHYEKRFVARVKSDRFKDIFWGHPTGDVEYKNKSPHFVG